MLYPPMQVSSGGVVRDPVVHQEVIKATVEGVEACGFVSQGHLESPLKGNTSGNIEFLAYFKRGAAGAGEGTGEVTPVEEDAGQS